MDDYACPECGSKIFMQKVRLGGFGHVVIDLDRREVDYSGIHEGATYTHFKTWECGDCGHACRNAPFSTDSFDGGAD